MVGEKPVTEMAVSGATVSKRVRQNQGSNNKLKSKRSLRTEGENSDANSVLKRVFTMFILKHVMFVFLKGIHEIVKQHFYFFRFDKT